MKTQLILIGGGNAFEKHGEFLEYLHNRPVSLDHFRPGLHWRNYLQKAEWGLGDLDVLIPQMPNKDNARYAEWKIWFDRIALLLDDDVILVGHSLGGLFLAKYLSENTFPKKIKALFLLAAPFNTPGRHPLVDFFIDPKLKGVEEQAEKIFIYHSKDDEIVPVVCAEEFKAALPSAKLEIFEKFGHLNQPEFWELYNELNRLLHPSN